MGREVYVWMVFLAFWWVGCEEKDVTETAPGKVKLIRKVQIETDRENVLRMDVEIEASDKVMATIEYWKEGGETNKRRFVLKEYKELQVAKLILLEEKSVYQLKITVTNPAGAEEMGMYRFTTGQLPAGLMQFTNLTPEYTYDFDGYIHIGDKKQGTLYLINSSGKIVWYQPTGGKSVICSGFDARTATFHAILGFNPNGSFTGEYIYVVDLYGKVLLKKHYTEFRNPYFHHDLVRLQNGDFLVVNQVRQAFDLTRWGGLADEMVTGDGFSVLTPSGETRWSWSAFDHISPEDDPGIMGDNGDFEFTPRGDWLHANAVYPCEDGHFLISFNRISQVWKVDGSTGTVIWKLGREGDIFLEDPADFSDRQHAVSVTPGGEVMLYDNGFSSRRSRIMAYRIDDRSEQGKVCLKIILPESDFSQNQSGAYQIDERRIVFGSVVPKTIGIVDRSGNLMWHYKVNNPFYRALYIELN